jgi:hypothetical protein
MKLISKANKKAKTSHMPNPTRVGPKSVDNTKFKVAGYMKSGSHSGKKKGRKHRSSKRHSK